ncbi:hypothetical protein HMPREF1870_00499 [Bacteroidales bacterium KA00344]|nr:hypothetical protein HMPREF1870_00499 [Bacteroidales bacterium KA00344]
MSYQLHSVYLQSCSGMASCHKQKKNEKQQNFTDGSIALRNNIH